MSIRWSFLFCAVVLLGCASGPRAQQQKQYVSHLKKWTKQDKQYSSMSASMVVKATLLSSTVLESQSRVSEVVQEWDPQTAQSEKDKLMAGIESETKFFVSFYTPDTDNNDLDQGQTQWNIFLDVGGRRFESKKVEKVFTNKATLRTQYPYHDTWSEPYLITFGLPTEEAQSQTSKLTIAGPIGSSHLSFSP